MESGVAKGRPESVAYNADFVAMVLPDVELNVNRRHIGMRNGDTIMSIGISNARGEEVLQGSAEVSLLTAVYVFAGQGLQESGVGMGYGSSSTAQAVWEGANAQLILRNHHCLRERRYTLASQRL